MYIKSGIFGIFLLFAAACATVKPREFSEKKPSEKPKSEPEKPSMEEAPAFDRTDYFRSTAGFAQRIADTASLAQHFVGFCLYDTETDSFVVRYNDRKYFTPASNTKLFTFFAGTKLLPDSLPGLRYIESGDSLIFWGTGDPTFLNPMLPQSGRQVFDFLKDTNKKLYFSGSNFIDSSFGSGWAWDDYNSAYSAEKSGFPIYGNVVLFEARPGAKVKISPSFFAKNATEDKKMSGRNIALRRDRIANNFRYKFDNLQSDYARFSPCITSSELTARLLADTLKKPVGLIDRPLPENSKILYSSPADSMYRFMMQLSDNFCAEQILLMASGQIDGRLSSRLTIGKERKELWENLGDFPRRADGSGLSRYNLMTPFSLVKLLQDIYNERVKKPEDEAYLFSLLSRGGQAGTLRNRFKGLPVFIFGKTGTLSNNHSLSGYLISKSGRRLIFSFMNNHYMIPTSEIRRQMDEILTDIYLNY